ncbi:hypothetical protein SteCoe_6166 [Stentor coeruleus]|uniref:Uncharacterized protein n=1 Tax=Stentor coeruleus TaxID=5963 RepID=A0A1R2CQM8_9CILI|nr:hypothetical protein SteCoe_6166 [Stentor coeruleus]
MGCSEISLSYEERKNNKYSRINQFEMYAALIKGNKDKANILLREGYNVNYRMPNFNYRSPLHIAVESGSIELVEFLISKGAKVDIRDVSGVPPVFLACSKGNLLMAEKLIFYGANVNAMTKYDWDIYKYISKDMHVSFKKMFERCNV